MGAAAGATLGVDGSDCVAMDHSIKQKYRGRGIARKSNKQRGCGFDQYMTILIHDHLERLSRTREQLTFQTQIGGGTYLVLGEEERLIRFALALELPWGRSIVQKLVLRRCFDGRKVARISEETDAAARVKIKRRFFG